MLLPEAARTGFARLARDTALLDARAGQVIIGSAIAAGSAALQPVPAIPDAALIAPIQISMIMALARLHGYDISPGNAIRLIGPLVGTMAGRMVFEQVMKLVPGAGSVMGAAVAGTITLSLGQAYHQLMKRNIWNPEKEALLETFTSFWQANKNLSLNEISLIKEPV
jgi:GTPase